MADLVIAEYEEIANVADAIRSKTGITDTMTLSEMASNVMSISGTDITIDSELSETSINPVQNKVVTQEIRQLSDSQIDPRRISDMYYSEGGIVELLPLTTVTEAEDGVLRLIATVDLEVGKTYIVNYNGVDYECVGQHISEDDMTAITLGNGSSMGLSGNNEPFFIAYFDGNMQVLDLNGLTEVTLSICINNSNIHKIPNKYIDLDWKPTFSETPTILLDETFEITSIDTPKALNKGSGFANNLENICNIVNVNYDGVDYECEVIKDNILGYRIGNDGLINEGFINNGIPFSIVFFGANINIRTTTTGTHTITVNVFKPIKMPEKYFPDSLDSIILRAVDSTDTTRYFRITVDSSNSTLVVREVTE